LNLGREGFQGSFSELSCAIFEISSLLSLLQNEAPELKDDSLRTI